jgi:hypothetical protein
MLKIFLIGSLIIKMVFSQECNELCYANNKFNEHKLIHNIEEFKEDEILNHYDLHIKEHHVDYKNFNSSEYNERYEIFKKNLKIINEHNKQNHTWTMGLTKFAASYSSEICSIPGNCYSPDSNEVQSVNGCTTIYENILTDLYCPLPSTSLLNLPDRCNIQITSPDTYDWTSSVPGMNACGINVVTPVVNQNLCGSCYAFSAIAAVESSISIATGVLSAPLSAQQIIDCTYNTPIGPPSNIKNTGCFGGYVSISMLYAANSQYGLCTSLVYPYNGYTGQCTEQRCAGGAKIVGFNNVKNIDKIKLQNYIRNNGPVVATIQMSFSMLFYRNLNGISIYTGACGLPFISGHSVLVVGFGVLNGRSYWKIKNSWGVSWGYGGYMYLDADSMNGKCGIFTDIFYVQ